MSTKMSAVKEIIEYLQTLDEDEYIVCPVVRREFMKLICPKFKDEQVWNAYVEKYDNVICDNMQNEFISFCHEVI